MMKPTNLYIIGFDGGSCAGKSSVFNSIIRTHGYIYDDVNFIYEDEVVTRLFANQPDRVTDIHFQCEVIGLMLCGIEKACKIAEANPDKKFVLITDRTLLPTVSDKVYMPKAFSALFNKKFIESIYDVVFLFHDATDIVSQDGNDTKLGNIYRREKDFEEIHKLAKVTAKAVREYAIERIEVPVFTQFEDKIDYVNEFIDECITNFKKDVNEKCLIKN